MEKFGKFILGLLFVALNIFVTSVVLMYCWNWFIVPFGVARIGILWAWGISLTLSMFSLTKKGKAETENFSDFTLQQIVNILVVLIVWGVCALIQLGL